MEKSEFAVSSFEKEQLLVLRDRFVVRYNEIEERARETLREGRVADNPILTGKKKDPRYSISAEGLIFGVADSFLQKATAQIKRVEPNARYMPDGFRHVTLREGIYHPEGRRAAGVSAEKARAYHRALQENLQSYDPIRLELVKVMPTIDREQSSVAVVAAFLPKDDLTIVKVREDISAAIEKAGLPLGARLGQIKAIFVTLARFPHPPRREEERVPLLETLAKINSEIPPDCEAVIKSIYPISTTPISYIWADRHVFIWPPISLTKEAQREEPTRFLTPSQFQSKMGDRAI